MGRPWFRFEGLAGNQLLNKCPRVYECGSHAQFWSSDLVAPQTGVISDYQFLGSLDGNCTAFAQPGRAMRCSEKPNDVIYKYMGEGTALLDAFCGMD